MEQREEVIRRINRVIPVPWLGATDTNEARYSQDRDKRVSCSYIVSIIIVIILRGKMEQHVSQHTLRIGSECVMYLMCVTAITRNAKGWYTVTRALMHTKYNNLLRFDASDASKGVLMCTLAVLEDDDHHDLGITVKQMR
jgi:hypothetical protein